MSDGGLSSATEGLGGAAAHSVISPTPVPVTTPTTVAAPSSTATGTAAVPPVSDLVSQATAGGGGGETANIGGENNAPNSGVQFSDMVSAVGEHIASTPFSDVLTVLGIAGAIASGVGIGPALALGAAKYGAGQMLQHPVNTVLHALGFGSSDGGGSSPIDLSGSSLAGAVTGAANTSSPSALAGSLGAGVSGTAGGSLGNIVDPVGMGGAAALGGGIGAGGAGGTTGTSGAAGTGQAA